MPAAAVDAVSSQHKVGRMPRPANNDARLMVVLEKFGHAYIHMDLDAQRQCIPVKGGLIVASVGVAKREAVVLEDHLLDVQHFAFLIVDRGLLGPGASLLDLWQHLAPFRNDPARIGRHHDEVACSRSAEVYTK